MGKSASSLEAGGKEETASPLKEMRDIKNEMETCLGMLHDTEDSIQEVFSDLKFWRDKNIEGDIIILDESLNKLGMQVNKQCRAVSNYFNTVSLDIVKIKEKVNNQHSERSVKYVKSHDTEGKDKKISLGFVSIGLKN